jgi:uncharacterized membrane protein YjjP (DUF1212 family)
MMNEKDSLIKCLLDLGEALYVSGAEINRIEDSLSRIGVAYGLKHVDAFVLTSIVNITVTYPDGSINTGSRRLNMSVSTDFDKLEELNSICRNCADLSICEFDKKIQEINGKKRKKLIEYVGSVLATIGFTMFFGGTVSDAVVAGIFAVMICLLQNSFSKICPNKVFFYLVTSAAVGAMIILCAHFIPTLNVDKIIIGDIMLLIPGINITNAARDIVIGDTVSGIVKFSESLLFAVSLAGGFMLAMAVLGGVL